MSAVTVPISFSSPSAFAVAEMPRSSVLEYERRVRFLVVSGRQDDGLWGPIGALWLSDDGARGGFLVNPYALWNGSEIARSYRSAPKRGWRPAAIFATGPRRSGEGCTRSTRSRARRPWRCWPSSSTPCSANDQTHDRPDAC